MWRNMNLATLVWPMSIPRMARKLDLIESTLLAGTSRLSIIRRRHDHSPRSVPVSVIAFAGVSTGSGFRAKWESSTVLFKPVHTVRRELRLAQAWLRKKMSRENTTEETSTRQHDLPAIELTGPPWHRPPDRATLPGNRRPQPECDQ